MFVCRQCRLAATTLAIINFKKAGKIVAPSIHAKKLSILLPKFVNSFNHSSNHEDDDEHIVEAIDQPPRQQQRIPYLFQSTKPITGLFGYTSLHYPNDLIIAAQEALNQAQSLVELVCNTTNNENELRKVVKRLDRLSDLICSIVDGAEIVKNLHPDSRWVAAAKHASFLLSNYLNQLNTHTGVYMVLKKAVSNPSIASQWDKQELQVARLLLSDFEKNGIHLSRMTRDKVVELHNRILSVGQDFVNGAGSHMPYVVFEDAYNELAGVPKEIIDTCIISENRHKFSSRWNNANKSESALAVIPMPSFAANAVLRFARNEQSRKRIFEASNSSTKNQIALLEELLRTRAEVANVMGWRSYASLHLSDKMAKTPENVMAFLNDLANMYKPKAESRLQQLRDIKRSHTAFSTEPDIHAWDQLFYSQFTINSSHNIDNTNLISSFHSSHQTHTISNAGGQHVLDAISAYLTPGLAFKGIAYLFRTLYGVKLQVVPTTPGETWHSDVVRLDVLSELDSTVLGTIYCDLYQREVGGGRKYESAAHFTVRGSRRLDFDDADIESSAMSRPSLQRRDGVAIVDNKKYQKPVVVLVTSFPRPSGTKPCFLSLQDSEALFHEMGHALHSILAKTDYQHIAGTRCSVDFVEIPSMFHERFVRHPVVLSYIARHYSTGKPLPPATLEATAKISGYGTSFEVLSQVQAAALDQAFHSSEALSASFDSIQVAKQVQEKYHLIPYVEGTTSHAQFTHFYPYGASYYSYFWSRKWAEKIYEKLFNVGVDKRGHDDVKDVWRKGGELVWKELMAPGGGRDPYVSLQKLGLDVEEEMKRSI